MLFTIIPVRDINTLELLEPAVSITRGPSQLPEQFCERLIRRCQYETDAATFTNGLPRFSCYHIHCENDMWELTVEATYHRDCPVGGRFARSLGPAHASIPTATTVLQGRMELEI